MTNSVHRKNEPRTYYRVLTIAGSDSGGGAGIQADIKTIASLGAHPLTVVTAVTAQSSVAVTSIHGIPSDFILKQLDTVLHDQLYKQIMFYLLN